MKTVTTVEEVLLEAEEMVHTEDISTEEKAILNNIDSLVNSLRGHGAYSKNFKEHSADELSRIAGSLALLKDSLVDILSKAGRQTKVQEALIKLNRANLRDAAIKTLIAAGEKTSVDAIKSYTNKRLFKAKIKLAFLEEHAERMIYKWRSINSLLDVISNRINVLQSQRADVRISDTDMGIDLNSLNKNIN